MKGVVSLNAAEEKRAVGHAESRSRVEEIALQPIRSDEVDEAQARPLELTKPALRSEPEIARFIFENGSHDRAGESIALSIMSEGAGGLVILLQSSSRTEPHRPVSRFMQR